MASIPDIVQTIRDGALGVVPSNGNQICLKFGVAPLGAVNTLLSASDPTALAAAVGKGGPLAESAAYSLSIAGGPVYACVCNPSSYGTVGSVTKTVSGGAGTLTASAKPSFTILAKVTTGGAVATAQVAFSFDGGVTYGAPVVTAATLMIPGATLVTLAFTGGTGGSFVAGDIWTIGTGTTAPALTGTGTGTVTLSSVSPVDAYSAIVTIAAGGALGTATFTYSLDGGNTVSSAIVVPGSGIYTLPDTGVVLTFASAQTTGDTWTFSTTAAGYSTTDLTNAFNAIIADPRTWAMMHVVGAPSSVAGAATLLATVDTLLNTAAGLSRYACAFIEAPTDTDSNTITAFVAASSLRVGCGAGFGYTTSPLNGRIVSRNEAWHLTARLAKIAPSTDPGRFNDGPVPGIPSSLSSGAKALSRDEQATPGLDAARFCTLRTITGQPGFFLTAGRMMAPLGSDYTFVQNRRVMDLACSAARQAMLRYLNDGVRVDSTTGLILEKEALAIEAYATNYLRTQITQPGYASDVSVTVGRTQNILSTSILPVTVRVTPLGYARSITVDIGFSNPALQLK